MASQHPVDTKGNPPTDRRDASLPPTRHGSPEQGSPDQAAGTVTQPISPGEAQAGNLNEQAGNLGGPVDIFRLNQGSARETTEG